MAHAVFWRVFACNTFLSLNLQISLLSCKQCLFGCVFTSTFSIGLLTGKCTLRSHYSHQSPQAAFCHLDAILSGRLLPLLLSPVFRCSPSEMRCLSASPAALPTPHAMLSRLLTLGYCGCIFSPLWCYLFFRNNSNLYHAIEFPLLNVSLATFSFYLRALSKLFQRFEMGGSQE